MLSEYSAERIVEKEAILGKKMSSSEQDAARCSNHLSDHVLSHESFVTCYLFVQKRFRAV
jgi:hypothetical protein